jgi:hypothetical protein
LLPVSVDPHDDIVATITGVRNPVCTAPPVARRVEHGRSRLPRPIAGIVHGPVVDNENIGYRSRSARTNPPIDLPPGMPGR